jgi:hypothetical protein
MIGIFIVKKYKWTIEQFKPVGKPKIFFSLKQATEYVYNQCGLKANRGSVCWMTENFNVTDDGHYVYIIEEPMIIDILRYGA